MKYSKNKENQRGQALAPLLVFMAIGLIVTSAAIILVLVNSTSASRFQLSNTALSTAESGAENAMMRMLKDPSYVGETLAIGEDGVATITVTGTNPKTINVVGQLLSESRTVEVVYALAGGVWSVTSWKELP